MKALPICRLAETDNTSNSSPAWSATCHDIYPRKCVPLFIFLLRRKLRASQTKRPTPSVIWSMPWVFVVPRITWLEFQNQGTMQTNDYFSYPYVNERRMTGASGQPGHTSAHPKGPNHMIITINKWRTSVGSFNLITKGTDMGSHTPYIFTSSALSW